MTDLTTEQQAVVAKLLKRGFVENRVQHFEGEPAPTVFLSKRVNSYSTRYAEVGPDASINGDSNIDSAIKSLLS